MTVCGMEFPEAKAEILWALSGLPHRERLDGKCLIANCTLAGLIGGEIVAGRATHRTEGVVGHCWVEKDGKTFDALEDYYDHLEKVDGSGPGYFGADAWSAATCGEPEEGVTGILLWRMIRSMGMPQKKST